MNDTGKFGKAPVVAKASPIVFEPVIPKELSFFKGKRTCKVCRLETNPGA
jgi:hypothetical protein